ncbi:hypothetical protein AB833_31710 [Chromatiales bacterium (ex Bugula neritina AB1)]|nr:hypothetical protein AB833_31710 [Chromatiales bacterium (ex Bugula neritina AB1)]
MKQSIGDYIQHYNHERLHSAIGYVTPAQKLQGQERDIFKRREEKLAQAREDRKNRRQQARATAEAAA